MNQTKDVRKGAGFGYERDDGTICMIRCFHCGMENFAMAVASGKCAWCGKDGKDELEEEKDGSKSRD